MTKNKNSPTSSIYSKNKTTPMIYENFFKENKEPLTPIDIDGIINLKQTAILNFYNTNFNYPSDDEKSDYFRLADNQLKKNFYEKQILKKFFHKEKNFISLKNNKIKMGELCLYSFKGKDNTHSINEITNKENFLLSSQNFYTIPGKDIITYQFHKVKELEDKKRKESIIKRNSIASTFSALNKSQRLKTAKNSKIFGNVSENRYRNSMAFVNFSKIFSKKVLYDNDDIFKLNENSINLPMTIMNTKIKRNNSETKTCEIIKKSNNNNEILNYKKFLPSKSLNIKCASLTNYNNKFIKKKIYNIFPLKIPNSGNNSKNVINNNEDLKPVLNINNSISTHLTKDYSDSITTVKKNNLTLKNFFRGKKKIFSRNIDNGLLKLNKHTNKINNQLIKLIKGNHFSKDKINNIISKMKKNNIDVKKVLIDKSPKNNKKIKSKINVKKIIQSAEKTVNDALLYKDPNKKIKLVANKFCKMSDDIALYLVDEIYKDDIPKGNIKGLSELKKKRTKDNRRKIYENYKKKLIQNHYNMQILKNKIEFERKKALSSEK